MPVKVKGVIELRKALRQFEPDLAKETNKEVTSFLKPVVAKARGYLPSNEDVPSGWLKRENAEGRWANRYYDQAEAKRGIKYKTTPSKPNREGWRSVASLINQPVDKVNVGGLIYETAGRKSGIVGKFTPLLGGMLKGSKRSMTGRTMFRAFNEDQGKAVTGVAKALKRAEDKFYGRTR